MGAAGAPEESAGAAGDGGSTPEEEGGAPSESGGTGGSAGGTAGTGGTGAPDDPAADYLNKLSVWGTVPPANDTPEPTSTQKRMLNTSSNLPWPFSCEIAARMTSSRITMKILNLGGASEYIKPGMLLSGKGFLKGQLLPIPLPRAPITLSIDVAKVQVASLTIQNAQTRPVFSRGIATLQAQADAAVNHGTPQGQYAAALTYSQQLVQSSEELDYKLGLSASFNGVVTKAKFDTEFSQESTREQYTLATQLMQSMYTITFAQDQFQNARVFRAEPELE